MAAERRDLALPPLPAGAPRIAAVLTQLGFGGAERQTTLLLEALAGTPWAPALVVCLSDDLEPYGPRLERAGYRVVVLERRGSFDFARRTRLARLMRTERIALVHAVHLLASAYAWLACRGAGAPRVLASVRGAVAGRGMLRRLAYRRMVRACPATLVNSTRGARFLFDALGAPRERVVVVHNGIDFAALRARAQADGVREALGIDPAAPVVLYVGKDSPVKNVPRAVEIVRRLHAERPGLVALFAGGRLGPDDRARLAPGMPQAAVRFLGPRDDVPALAAASDLLLLTSDSEGSPNVVLEALGAGTPVVSSDVGDVADMLGPDGACGRALAPADVDAYVAAALPLLADRPAARAAVVAAGPRLEAAYGLDAMVLHTVALWRHLLDGGVGAPAKG